MARFTSIEAYNEVISSGALGRMQEIAYDVLYKHGPCTGQEAYEHTTQLGGSGCNMSDIRTRLYELRNKGLAVEKGTTICKVTGKRVILWDAVREFDKLPVPREPATPRVQAKMYRAIAEAAIVRLKALGDDTAATLAARIYEVENADFVDQVKWWKEEE